METRKVKERIFPFRIDNDLHTELRKASYLTALPMAELVRLGIQLKLKEIKKMLTNAEGLV